MADPIVFVKCDSRPGHEALSLIYRPNRSTAKNEHHITIRARSLAPEALSEIEDFINVARSILGTIERGHDRPLEFVSVDDPSGPAAVW